MTEVPMQYGFNVLDHLKGLPVPELKEIAQQDRLPYAVMCLNLEYDLNIGNTIRTGHLLGAERILIVGNSKVDTRACVGSQNYTHVEKFKIPEGMSVREAVMHKMHEHRYYPLFVEYNARSQPLSKMARAVPMLLDHGFKPCLVLGNENKGIDAEVMGEFQAFHIPQRGILRSLNVSSAAAIAMWELAQAVGHAA